MTLKEEMRYASKKRKNKYSGNQHQAIRTAVENAGGVEAFTELLTCSHSTISKYKSGQIEDVHAATWKRLLPLIQEYLPMEGK